MNNKNKVFNIIFKILSLLFLGYIIALITIDFFDTSKSYTTTEIIVLMCIALIIVLGDAFDSFQIGNLISIKKENNNLKEQIKTMSQVMNNINNITITAGAEVAMKKEDATLNKHSEPNKATSSLIKENELISKYLERYNLNNATIIRDAIIRINNSFENSSMPFDCYLKSKNMEQFIEIKLLVPMHDNFYYLHKQLQYVSYYNRENSANAQYVLVLSKKIMEGNNKISETNRKHYENMINLFKDIIDKGIMKIELI